MNIIHTIVMGLVEGLTEFIPVSSTGHLLLTGHFLGLDIGSDSAAWKGFEIFIQLGAILAVLVLYRDRFKSLFQFSPNPENNSLFYGKRAWLCLLSTTIPTLAIGFALRNFVDSALQPLSVTLAIIVGGLLIILVEKFIHLPEHTTEVGQLSLRQCVCLGIAQCMAIVWPGFSRSGATIIAGLFLGMNRQTAAEYSFLAAVPVIAAASIYSLLKIIHTLTPDMLTTYAIGFVVAFVSALLAIQFFIKQLQKHSMFGFGLYRIVFGTIVLLVLGQH